MENKKDIKIISFDYASIYPSTFSFSKEFFEELKRKNREKKLKRILGKQ